MEISDYSNRLSQIKKDYSDTADKLRDNYKKDLKDLEKNHEAREKKQAENYRSSKEELEAKNEENNRLYSKVTKDTINERTKVFREGLEDQRTDFEQERQEIKRGFDDRLNSLRDSYTRSSREKDKFQDFQLDGAKERYEDRLAKLESSYNDSFSRLDKETDRKFNQYQSEQAAEKRNLIDRYSNEKAELVKNGSLEKTKVADQHHKDIENLRKAQGTELEQLKDYQKNQLESVRNLKNDEHKELQQSFRALTEDIGDRNQRLRRSEVRAQTENAEKLEEENAKRLYQQRREFAAKLNGGNADNHYQQKEANIRRSYDDRIKNIYETMDDERFKNSQDKERMASSFIESNRELKEKQSEKLMAKDKEFKAFKETTLADASEKSEQAIDAYKRELYKTRVDNEEQTIKNRTDFKSNIAKERAYYGNVINKLSDKNREAVESIQQQHAKETSAFIEKTKKDHARDLSVVREDAKLQLSLKEQSLTERNQQLKEINDRLVEQYEVKLDKLAKKAHDEIERLQQMNEDQRVQGQLDAKFALEARDREVKKEKVEMKNLYERRINEAKSHAEKQVSQIIERYEDMIARERDDMKRKMDVKLKEAQANYDKLYQLSELEKTTMQTKFDQRLEEMRTANQEALAEKAAQYKSNFHKA